MFINLGDTYSSWQGIRETHDQNLSGKRKSRGEGKGFIRGAPGVWGIPPKSLIGIPWRYALACVDELGLILRRDIIWSKPNGIPESVNDRCRTSHEYIFHLVKQGRYYTAVDEIREEHAPESYARFAPGRALPGRRPAHIYNGHPEQTLSLEKGLHPLGRLPGSVWTFPVQPLIGPQCRLVRDGRTVRWFTTWAEGEKHMRTLTRDVYAFGAWGRPSLRPEGEHYACVDADTEILTRRGWLHHDQLRDDDQVAGHDMDTGLARWTGLHGIHRYDFDGELVSVDGRGLSMRLTSNHRVIAHTHTGSHHFRQPAKVILADDLDRTHSIPRSVQWAEDGCEKSIGIDLAALLGWVAAEGWVNYRRIMLSQSLTANPANVAEIDALIHRLGDPGYKARERIWRGRPWIDCSWSLSRELSAEVLRLLPHKLLSAGLSDLPLDDARALLDAFIAGDGHRRADNGRISIFQRDRHNLDVLQSIAVRLGYNTTLRPSGQRWVLYLNAPRPHLLRSFDGRSLVSREHYRGIVWCVTTATGTFVARRNGSVFVTGNSFPMELPRRIITGWSPSGICNACGQGRRPVAVVTEAWHSGSTERIIPMSRDTVHGRDGRGGQRIQTTRGITGYVCDCPDTSAAVRPAVVLDPFGGTGCTAVVAAANGRIGITVDYSHSYSRFARWRTSDSAERAKAMQVRKPPPPPDHRQQALFDLEEL